MYSFIARNIFLLFTSCPSMMTAGITPVFSAFSLKWGSERNGMPVSSCRNVTGYGRSDRNGKILKRNGHLPRSSLELELLEATSVVAAAPRRGNSGIFWPRLRKNSTAVHLICHGKARPIVEMINAFLYRLSFHHVHTPFRAPFITPRICCDCPCLRMMPSLSPRFRS